MSFDTSLDRELDLPEYKTFAGELERLEDNKLSEGSVKRQETLQALSEANKRATAAYKIADQDELATWRPGRIMHVSELMRKLHQVCQNPKLNEYGALGMVGLTVEAPSSKGSVRQYVCAVPAGNMPEYSQIRIGKHGEVVNEKYRGWRTVLIRLLEIGAVTESALEKVFGPPTPFGSGPYLSQVRALRKA